MNPYEFPQVQDAWTPKPGGRKKTVVLVLFLSAAAIFSTTMMLKVVHIKMDAARQAELNQRQAEAEEVQRREVAASADSPQESTLKVFEWPEVPKTTRRNSQP